MQRALPDLITAQRFRILHYNGLFGYQYEDGILPGEFVLCYCNSDMPTATFQSIKEKSGATTLYLGDYLGNGYLKIFWTDHERVAAIFNQMLAHGQSFQTRNNASVSFRPERDKEFTDEIMEINFIKQTHDMRDMMAKCGGGANGLNLLKRAAFKPWNYQTELGKAFCHALRRDAHKKPANMESEGNYWKWAIFQNRGGSAAAAVCGQPLASTVCGPPPGSPTVHPGSAGMDCEDFICLICFDAPPTTTVHPCKCCVVCAKCSEGLKQTNDAKTCVKCRRQIERIE